MIVLSILTKFWNGELSTSNLYLWSHSKDPGKNTLNVRGCPNCVTSEKYGQKFGSKFHTYGSLKVDWFDL